MGWLDEVRDHCKREKTARVLYEQCAIRLDEIRTEIETINASLKSAHMVIDHHKSRQDSRPMLRYSLANGQTISSREFQRRRSRQEALRQVLPGLQDQYAKYEVAWQQCARRLRELVIAPILNSDLTNEQRESIEKEVDCDDVVVHVSPNRPVVHVYFGDPDNDESHGHAVVDDTWDCLHARPRGPRERQDRTSLGMIRVRAFARTLGLNFILQ